MWKVVSALTRRVARAMLRGNAYAAYLGVKFGLGCRIYTKEWGTEPFLVSLGDRVTLTAGVQILTHDGATWLVRDVHGVRYQRYRPVRIGDDVFVGINSIIMPGVTIGSRVVIGAGSVVTRDVPDDTVAVGNPARAVRTFEEYAEGIRAKEVLESELASVSGYRDRVDRAVRLAARK